MKNIVKKKKKPFVAHPLSDREIINDFKEEFGIKRFNEANVAQIVESIGYWWIGRDPHKTDGRYFIAMPSEVATLFGEIILIRNRYEFLIDIAIDLLDGRLSKKDIKTWMPIQTTAEDRIHSFQEIDKGFRKKMEKDMKKRMNHFLKG